jgi:hypothetical protein
MGGEICVECVDGSPRRGSRKSWRVDKEHNRRDKCSGDTFIIQETRILE